MKKGKRKTSVLMRMSSEKLCIDGDSAMSLLRLEIANLYHPLGAAVHQRPLA